MDSAVNLSISTLCKHVYSPPDLHFNTNTNYLCLSVCLSFKDGPAVLTAFRINLHSGMGRSEALCDAYLSVLSSSSSAVSLFIHLLSHLVKLSSIMDHISGSVLLLLHCFPVSLPIRHRCLCVSLLFQLSHLQSLASGS